jgi:hypothetical protein
VLETLWPLETMFPEAEQLETEARARAGPAVMGTWPYESSASWVMAKELAVVVLTLPTATPTVAVQYASVVEKSLHVSSAVWARSPENDAAAPDDV